MLCGRTIGNRTARLFCPPPSIWNSHLETASYSIWLNSRPDFVNLFAVELGQHEFRIAAERATSPRDFILTDRGVEVCSDIFLETKDPSIIREISVYERDGTDVAMYFRFDRDSGFGIYAGDAAGEVCFFWQAQWSKVQKEFAIRIRID